MKASKQHCKLKCDTSWLAGDPVPQGNSLASGRDISQQLSRHRHWHFSYCRLPWQKDSLQQCRLLRALWTALISYWSPARAWWLVTHLSRGLPIARYLKAIKNKKKNPPSYCSKVSTMVKHFIVRDQFCTARIKPLCAQDRAFGEGKCRTTPTGINFCLSSALGTCTLRTPYIYKTNH